MLTTDGKRHIKRYLAGHVNEIAASIAYGLGNSAESLASTRLQFEVDREELTLTSYDFVNDRLVFKAELPEDFEGSIYEVGVFSQVENDLAGSYGSEMILTFDSETEDWFVSGSVASTFATGSSRLGADSLRQTVAASGNKTDTLNNLSLDLSGYSGSDKFVLAFNASTAFASALRLRLINDGSNYFDFNIGAQTAGYKVLELAKSTATATGSPDWSNITSIQVTTSAAAGGGVDVDFDGLRMEDDDSTNPNYVMISRKVLATPIVKESGKTQEIEFSMNVSL